MNNGISLAKIDCESSIDRAARDFEFAYALMQQNKEMEDFVNESLILASGNKYAINEMVIIHEAAAGDKIKAFFEKIKNFFKKIFDKLGAAMNALFQEQKKYIEQYQYIITKCKWQCGDVSDVYDFFIGLPRIIDCTDKGEEAILGKNLDKYLKGEGAAFTGDDANYFIKLSTFTKPEDVTNELNRLKNNPPDMAKKKAELFKEFKQQSNYWNTADGFTIQNDADGNANVNETFKDWFNGSSDTRTYSGDEIESNFQTVINVCYAGQSYMNKLEKIVTTVSNKMDAAYKSMDDFMKQQREKVMAAVKKADEDKKKADEAAKGNTGVRQTKDVITTDEYNAASNKDDYDVDPDNPNQYKKKSGSTTPQEIKILKSSLNPQQQTENGKTEYVCKYTPTDGSKKNTELIGRGNTGDEAINNLKSQLGAEYTIENYNYRGYRNYFNEANVGTGNSSSSTESRPSDLSGSGSRPVKDAGETNSKISNHQVNKMNAQDVQGAAAGISKDAEELLNLDINHRQTCINAEVQISTAIAQSAFNAFKRTNKDCFDILKGHVQWYLSNPGAEKQTENQTTRPRQVEMSVGGKPVTHNSPESTPAPAHEG